MVRKKKLDARKNNKRHISKNDEDNYRKDVAKIISDATKNNNILKKMVASPNDYKSTDEASVSNKKKKKRKINNSSDNNNNNNNPYYKEKKQKRNSTSKKSNFKSNGRNIYDQEDDKKLDNEVIASKNKRQKLMLKNESVDESNAWYNHEYANDKNIIKLSAVELKNKLPLIKKWANHAEDLLKQLVNEHNKEKSLGKSNGDERLMNKFLKSGTIADKVAALSVLLYDSPLLYLDHLNQLLKMAQRKGTREANIAIGSLHDLFRYNLLPNRKLYYFHDHNLPNNFDPNNSDITSNQLIYWYFEGELKKKYSVFIDALENTSHETMSFSKKGAVVMLYELLSAKPEKERRLLNAFINKLGDPERKISSKVIYLTGILLKEHPGMKKEVVREVEQLIFRPNMKERIKYYGITLLNEIILNAEQPDLANHLIKTYLNIFNEMIGLSVLHSKKETTNQRIKSKKKKRQHFHEKQQQKLKLKDPHPNVVKQMASKMLAAILTGLYRAIPYSSLDSNVLEEHLDSLFKVVHMAQFNASVQALMVINQLVEKQNNMKERFFRALYEKLVSIELQESRRKEMFLNLLYRSLKNDTSMERVAAFCKRILEIALTSFRSEFVCGLLFLLSELLQIHKGVYYSMVQGADWNNQKQAEFEIVDTNGQLCEKMESITGYDCKKRDPQFSGAHHTLLWELNLLQQHFHPTTVKWIDMIMSGQRIKYEGDPLLDFTSTAFLDRFVYRNPKKVDDRLSRIRKGNAQLLPSQKKRRSTLPPVNTSAFIDQDISRIPVDEVKRKKVGGEKKKKKIDEVDIDDLELDAFTNEIISQEMKKHGANMDDFMDDDDNDNDDDFNYTSDEEEQDDLKENSCSDNDIDGQFNLDSNDEIDLPIEFDNDEVDSNDNNRDDDEDDNEPKSVFASVEEFADILEKSGTSDVNPRQLKWENRHVSSKSKMKRTKSGKKYSRKRK